MKMTVTGIHPSAVKLIIWSNVPVPIVTLAAALRFLSRRHIKSVGGDDWWMLCALLLYYSLCSVFVVEASIGKLGFPTDELDYDQIRQYLKILFCTEILTGLAGCATKVSILLTYRRIFIQRTFRVVTLVVGMIVVIWLAAVLFTSIFECFPVGSFWEPLEQVKCVDSLKFFAGVGISSLILDVIILSLPIPMIWRLQMSLKRKVTLTIVFLLGLFACIASFLRISSVWLVDGGDISGSKFAISGIWLALELALSIICSCLLTLAPLFYHWQRVISSKWGRSNSRILRSAARAVRTIGGEGEGHNVRATASLAGRHDQSKVGSRREDRVDPTP